MGILTVFEIKGEGLSFADGTLLDLEMVMSLGDQFVLVKNEEISGKNFSSNKKKIPFFTDSKNAFLRLALYDKTKLGRTLLFTKSFELETFVFTKKDVNYLIADQKLVLSQYNEQLKGNFKFSVIF